ncbi:MAG: hypothetical protein M0C28_37855 [Candidatus Moduliflexus flocculans]|nr:hypothetical protein [Candidatus Moduliflexus flocculans]
MKRERHPYLTLPLLSLFVLLAACSSGPKAVKTAPGPAVQTPPVAAEETPAAEATAPQKLIINNLTRNPSGTIRPSHQAPKRPRRTRPRSSRMPSPPTRKPRQPWNARTWKGPWPSSTRPTAS